MCVITLQIGKSWISPVAGGEAQIAPHQSFVQSEWLRVDNNEVHGWSDNNHVARETTLRSLRSRSAAIWLNLPEEQADLKD